MVLDQSQPDAVDQWVSPERARAGLGGDLRILDGVIVKLEGEIESRRHQS